MRSAVTRWRTTAAGSYTSEALGRHCRKRIPSSVSSQPRGRDPTRPRPSVNPPMVPNTSRRKDMLAPMSWPDGRGSPADTDNRGIRVPGSEAFQPVRLGPGVVVEEGDDVADRLRDTGVACPGEATPTRIGDDLEVGECDLRALEQWEIVIHDEDRP